MSGQNFPTETCLPPLLPSALLLDLLALSFLVLSFWRISDAL
jgi:hypothetical protein